MRFQNELQFVEFRIVCRGNYFNRDLWARLVVHNSNESFPPEAEITHRYFDRLTENFIEQRPLWWMLAEDTISVPLSLETIDIIQVVFKSNTHELHSSVYSSYVQMSKNHYQNRNIIYDEHKILYYYLQMVLQS